MYIHEALYLHTDTACIQEVNWVLLRVVPINMLKTYMKFNTLVHVPMHFIVNSRRLPIPYAHVTYAVVW